MPKHGLYGTLFYRRNFSFLRRIVYFTLKLLSIEIPVSVQIGRELILVHGGFGIVIHPKTTIKDNVRIYPGVTLGRGDVYRPPDESPLRRLSFNPALSLAPEQRYCATTAYSSLGTIQ